MDAIKTIDPINLLILVLAVIGGAWLLFKVASRIIKTVGILLIVALVFFIWRGGNIGDLSGGGLDVLLPGSFTDLEERVCKEDREEKTRCQCLAQPIMAELRTIYSADQLAAFDDDPDQRRAVLQTAYQAQRSDIHRCLRDRGGEKLLQVLDRIDAARDEVAEPTPQPQPQAE